MEIVNAFDVKTDIWETNSSFIQLLPPSSLFNDLTAWRLMDEFSDAEWIMAGTEDKNDAVADFIKQRANTKIHFVSTEYLHDLNLDDNGKYAIYAYPQKKEEVMELLSAVTSLCEETPSATISVIGRPNWLTMTDNFQGKFRAADIIIPARCWFNPESAEGKKFLDKFKQEYDQLPVKSFPNFAVAGYDTARLFSRQIACNLGDFNKKNDADSSGLQTDLMIERKCNWGGFLNPMTYLLYFRPYGDVDKVLVK